LKIPIEVVIASIREPTDFAGLPVIRPSGVSFEPPRWAKRLHEAGEGILFLDEISTAPPAVQAALLRVVLDRVVGDLELPEKVWIVAAANPPEQAAGGWELSLPLANRFCHLPWRCELDDWANGMLTGWPTPDVKKLPEGWQELIPVKRALVTSFLKTRPELALQIPESEALQGRAWPSFRSWTMAATTLAGAASIKAPLDVEGLLVCGLVGDGAGGEFLHWVRNLDLPDPRQVLRNPDAVKIPETGDRQFALLSGVASVVINNLTQENWDAFWALVARYIQAKAADVTFVFAKAVISASHKRPNAETNPLLVPVDVGAELYPLFSAAGIMSKGQTRR